MIDVKLDLIISDTDMYLFIEKRRRGGASWIAQKYNKANNKYMKSYDKGNLSTYIIYEHSNTIYGWAISQYLLCWWV